MIPKIKLNSASFLFIVFNILLWSWSPLWSQQGACVKVEWSKNYGGFLNDGANSLIQTTDGGYLSVGSSRSNNQMLTSNHGKADYWIVKVDSLGELQWQSSFGGSENDIASDVVQTPDGGYMIVGGAVSFDVDVIGNNGSEDVWVLKLDANGNLQWSRTYGGSANERAESIEMTDDGNYIILGYSESFDGDVGQNKGDFDYWLLKINGGGDLLWERSFGGSLSDWGFDVKQTDDGGFLLAGSTISTNGNITGNNGFYDYWLVKTDANGNMLWQRNYGGTLEERAYSLAVTSDGGAIIAGTSNSSDMDVQGNSGSYDFWLTRIDANGNLIWARTFGGALEDRAFSVIELADGDFLTAGYSLSSSGTISTNYGSFDGWIIKFNANGDLIWERNLGGTEEDRLYSILERTGGGYATTGFSTSDDIELPDNFGIKDLWIVSLSPDTLSFDLGNDTTLCFSEQLVIQFDEIEDITYLWSDGSTEEFIAVNTSGEYWLEIDQEGCRTRDTIMVEYLSETEITLGNDTVLCEGETLLLSFDIPGAEYVWRDGSVNDSFMVDIPGSYWVEVNKDGCQERDTVEVNYAEIDLDFAESAFICEGEILQLDAEHPQATYSWQDGSNGPSYSISGPGLYWVNVDISGCIESDSIVVDFQPGPDSIFTATSFICEDEGIWFDASFPDATYLWQDGSTEPLFKAVTPGEYSVQVNINNCIFEESTELVSCERCLYIPNIFSPNEDGINDVFRTFPNCELNNYHEVIFDRWGNLVYEGFSTDEFWDGRYKGERAAQGTYVYFIEYNINNNGSDLPQARSGSVTIIR
ncbi:MAG: gliding motility-associated C-terminal domain-containing protein [Bacteroidota bacterium]